MKKLMSLTLCAFLFAACTNQKAEEPATETTPIAVESKEKAATEIGDYKYADIVRNGMTNLANGDIEGWLANFADNGVYAWNTGDSVAGKAAVMDYWKKRRIEVIDSLSFANSIFLPVVVNRPQSVEGTGNWVLGWYQVTAKYKTGKRMTQWMHSDTHFDANDKIDRVIIYQDRASINEAMKK